MALKVLFAGGGTGGHLYPAIAVADRLRERGDAVEFIGTHDRLEATIVPNAGYRLHAISSRPLARRPSFELLYTAAANGAGIAQSTVAIARFKPQLLIATGGYVCFPAVVSARATRVAAALLEPNAHPGLTNRLLAPLVREVWGAFPQADPRFSGKYVHTGVPVRESLLQLPSREAAIARLGLTETRRTLLVMGGSQGARSINDAVAAVIAAHELPAGWQIVHITGDKEYERVRRALGTDGAAVRPYVNDVSDVYAAADLVLCRAGASTLGELAAIGKPAVLVPYPHAADDHQRANAEAFAASGAALIATDVDVRDGKLAALLREATSVVTFERLQRGASLMRNRDAIDAILARIDCLTERKVRG